MGIGKPSNDLKRSQRTAKYYADILNTRNYSRRPLSLIGKADHEECRLFAFKNEDHAKEKLRKNLRIISGDSSKALERSGVMVTSGLARKLKLKVGE